MNALYQTHRVEFIENDALDLHTYILDGEISLMGVTELMKKHHLGHDYGKDKIDAEVLRHAAAMGTLAHHCIEDYCNGKAVVENSLIKSFQALGLHICATEYLMSDNETVASRIDLLQRDEDDPNTFDIIDMKRTSEVHTDSLEWQLGFYKWLFLMANPWAKVRNCYCLHIKKSNKNSVDKDICKPLILIKPRTEEECKAVIKAEQEGRIYEPLESTSALTCFTKEDELAAISTITNTLAMEEQIKPYEEALQHIKDAAYEFMLANGLDTMMVGPYKFSLRRPTIVESVDTKLLKTDHPDLVMEYTRRSERKGSVTIINSTKNGVRK